MNIEIANRLVQLRKKNGFSQEELAEKLGLSRQSVSKWERAEASPDTDNLILLSRLYGVSLDDLLSTQDDIPEPEKADQSEKSQAKQADTQAHDGTVNDTHSYEGDSKKGSHVHIGLDGIHVTDDEDGDEVHVSWKGVHVSDKNGEKVHVGFDGIHVEDAEDAVDVTKDGNVYVNGKQKHCFSHKAQCFWNYFPYPALIAAAYLLCGFMGWLGGWGVAWILFLTIPLYYTTVNAILKRKVASFAYPVLATAAYLICGFQNWLGGWGVAWILFLTVPLFYTLITAIRKHKFCLFAWPVLATLAFFCLGFYANLWHPGWAVFLTIPIYYSIFGPVDKAIKARWKHKKETLGYSSSCTGTGMDLDEDNDDDDSSDDQDAKNETDRDNPEASNGCKESSFSMNFDPANIHINGFDPSKVHVDPFQVNVGTDGVHVTYDHPQSNDPTDKDGKQQ